MGSAVDDIDFDDLTSPQLTDVQRQILQFTEAKRVDLDIDRMLAEAIDRPGSGAAGLDDTDGFGDRLRAHVAAIEADEGLTPAHPRFVAATDRAPASQPVVAHRADRAVSRDRVHPDRGVLSSSSGCRVRAPRIW